MGNISLNEVFRDLGVGIDSDNCFAMVIRQRDIPAAGKNLTGIIQNLDTGLFIHMFFPEFLHDLLRCVL